MKRGRAPLDPSGGRPTTGHELQLACGIVDRSGVVPVLEPYFTAEVGRHRLISLRGLLVACPSSTPWPVTTRPTSSRSPGWSTP